MFFNKKELDRNLEIKKKKKSEKERWNSSCISELKMQIRATETDKVKQINDDI